MGKQKDKEIKTNAMRILDKNKVEYEVLQYECEDFIDGIHVAKLTGTPVEETFKTLVLKGKSGQHYVLVLPIAYEVHLKNVAKLTGEKSVEMVHVKDITALTGYVRGGVSPLGMKKQFPTWIHESAKQFEKIYVSGGKLGLSVHVKTSDLAAVTKAGFGAFCIEDEDN